MAILGVLRLPVNLCSASISASLCKLHRAQAMPRSPGPTPRRPLRGAGLFRLESIPRLEEGHYLWRCPCYIELNMVRAGVVRHPREWEWVRFHEIMRQRKRNRLLDLDRLCWRLTTDDLGAVQKNLETSLAEALAREEVRREPCWTESLVVGSTEFVGRMQPLIAGRQETEIVEAADGVWALQEGEHAYSKETGPER